MFMVNLCIWKSALEVCGYLLLGAIIMLRCAPHRILGSTSFVYAAHNHKFTSKLESRGQSATLDKHWPSILSQLSVSVYPGGDWWIWWSPGGEGGGGGGGMQGEFSKKQLSNQHIWIILLLSIWFCIICLIICKVVFDVWNIKRSDALVAQQLLEYGSLYL